MSDEDIRNYLNSQAASLPTTNVPKPRMVMRKPKRPAPKPQDSFGDFSASHLFCPTCKRASPSRERLLLYLASGNVYDYICTVCGTSVGRKS